MRRAEAQLRLIQAVYRVESKRQHGAALDRLRERCESLLDLTAGQLDGDTNLRALLAEVRVQVRE